MKLIVLAAGSGTRLRPYTNDLPKCMVPVHDRALIDWLMDTVLAAGIDDVVIVRGYQAERLRLSTSRKPSRLSFVLNPEFASTNMVYSLWTARREITGPLIISYSDILYEAGVLRALMASPEEISVVVDRDWKPYWQTRFDDPLSDAESLRLDTDGNIKEIGQDVSDIGDVEGQYIGLMKFAGKGVDTLATTLDAAHQGDTRSPRNFRQMHMTDLLQGMIETGSRIRPHWINGRWLEVDSVKDLKIAEACIPADMEDSNAGPEIVRDRNTGG